MKIDGRLTFNVRKDDGGVPISCSEVVEVSDGQQRKFILSEWDLAANKKRVSRLEFDDQPSALRAYQDSSKLDWSNWV